MSEDDDKEMSSAIFEFANAYGRLQEVRAKHPLFFPRGALHLGAIAEYYVHYYLSACFGVEAVVFSGVNQAGWDIKVVQSLGDPLTYQVKAVGPFRMTREIEVRRGADKYALLSFNDALHPDRLHIVDKAVLFSDGARSRSVSIPNPGKTSRSKFLPQESDVTSEFGGYLEGPHPAVVYQVAPQDL